LLDLRRAPSNLTAFDPATVGREPRRRVDAYSGKLRFDRLLEGIVQAENRGKAKH
jgi:hypothetical protein